MRKWDSTGAAKAETDESNGSGTDLSQGFATRGRGNA